MMTGKKFPMNMRAMRMVVEELLRDILSIGHATSQEELLAELDSLSLKSRTAMMWIQNLIKPVFIMMAYVRAEREADWALHLYTVKLMIPYFFASAHVNYARYSLVYLRSMEGLPKDVVQKFWQGQHVMRHKAGIWNGLWSDMYIETTFMRYGHGKSGIIGITPKPETIETWALSLHVCGKMIQDLSDIRENASCSNVTKHKEEYAYRVTADSIDRKSIRSKLDTCIHPLEPNDHPKGLVNVVNGRIASDSVNVDNAEELGFKQMEEFERNLPRGFYSAKSKKAFLMSSGKKAIDIGGSKVYDTKLIYSRIIGVQASSRDLDFSDVMACELSPVPTALFDDCGDMRIAKSKATLKNQTKVEVSTRQTEKQQGESRTVIDGCALLWIPSWPSSSPTREATVADYVNKFKGKVADYLKSGDTYLIFDRYIDYSMKCTTRSSRGNDGSRVYQLSLSSPLPSQKLALTVSENKRQLIQIISKELQNDSDLMRWSRHKLVITDQEAVPTEVRPDGSLTRRQDMSTNHEEADTIIVQQAIKLAANDGSLTQVIADDTDVYILLLHHYNLQGLTSPIVMKSPIKDRTVIDIPGTVNKLKDIIHLILPGHALTGCDTVGACFGIGKGTLIKVLRNNPRMQLESVGDLEANMTTVINEATALIGACYGQPHTTSMTEARWNTWRSKVGRPGVTNMPNLFSLPPTTEAFTENTKRAHLQTWIWRKALEPNLDFPDPRDYGYTKDQKTKSLLPITVPTNVKLAPSSILKLIRCTCSSDMPCRTMACGCHKSKLACTLFCSCRGTIACQNSQTREARDVPNSAGEGDELDE